MTKRWALGFAAGVALTGTGWAFDAVQVTALLSDEDFFRAATCGAAPGDACKSPVLKWQKRDLTLAIVPSETGAGLIFGMLLSTTVDYALLQINRAGSGLTITRIGGPTADIRVALTDVAEGSTLPDVPGISAPGEMGVGFTTVWSTPDHIITDASILISNAITPNDIVSVVLEEIFQATGPVFDIDSPAYEGVSILSQTSNATVTIAGQDARLLRHLYPPEP